MTHRRRPPTRVIRRRATVRTIAFALAMASVLGATTPARADLLETSVLAPQSLDDPGTYPTNAVIGTFTYAVPAVGVLVGATISGQWGTSFLTPDTAAGIYSVNGVTVFTCNDADDCAASNTQTPWVYTFADSELASLAGGSAEFDVQQTDFGQVQTDVTTLTLDFNVPEPATIAVFGAALLTLGLLLTRRTRA